MTGRDLHLCMLYWSWYIVTGTQENNLVHKWQIKPCYQMVLSTLPCVRCQKNRLQVYPTGTDLFHWWGKSSCYFLFPPHHWLVVLMTQKCSFHSAWYLYQFQEESEHISATVLVAILQWQTDKKSITEVLFERRCIKNSKAFGYMTCDCNICLFRDIKFLTH